MDNTAAAPAAEVMDVEAKTGPAGEDGNKGNGDGRGKGSREGGKKRKAEKGGTGGVENEQEQEAKRVAAEHEELTGEALLVAVKQVRETYNGMMVHTYVSCIYVWYAFLYIAVTADISPWCWFTIPMFWYESAMLCRVLVACRVFVALSKRVSGRQVTRQL